MHRRTAQARRDLREIIGHIRDSSQLPRKARTSDRAMRKNSGCPTPVISRELMRLLRKLTDELQLTTVMVVHDINMAAAYADTIVAMKNGEILMSGTADEIITTENLQTVFNLDAEVLTHDGAAY